MQLIDIPYEADGFAMTVILPDGPLDAIEPSLDPGMLETVLAVLEPTDVHLFMPRFGFDFSASLPDALSALGMVDAFDPERADFSGMVPAPPDPPLVIGDVLHKAFIAVDEQGTEAAAATVVIMEVAAAPPEEEDPIELRLDRPFLFAIRDTVTGTILFLGRLTDPRG
jgi:serpin B